jgi:hypothetical protein
MIIELFGAPAAGKTTFARELAAQLRLRGHPVELILSYRPAEVSDDDSAPRVNGQVSRSPLAAMQRFTRPACEWLAAISQPPVGHSDTDIARELLAILPARNFHWSVRLSQYIARLGKTWRRVAMSDGISVVDQGFVQAVCSLTLLGRAPDESRVALALQTIPRADQLIRISAPRDVLEKRLDERRRGQNRIEQLLELDLETNMRSVEIVETLERILRRLDRPVITFDGCDPGSLPAVLAGIERAVAARLPAETYLPQA